MIKLSDFRLESVEQLIRGWRFLPNESTMRTAVFRHGDYRRAVIGANRKVVLCPWLDKLCGKDSQLRKRVTDIFTVVKDPIERMLALRIALDQVVLDSTDITLNGHIVNELGLYSREVSTLIYVGYEAIPAIYRGFIDWNIVDVPASTINDIDLTVQVTQAYGATDTVKITGFAGTQINLTNYPDNAGGNEALYGDIDTKATLVAASADFQSTGSKIIDLGADADAQLEANLALDFWSIGFKGSNESTDSTVFYSSSGTTPPTLTVTYTAC